MRKKTLLTYSYHRDMSNKTSNNSTQTNSNNSGNAGTTNSTVVSTRVPGVDMTQVIASPPHLVKENSAKVETKVIIRETRNRG